MKAWKDAASVILAARQGQKINRTVSSSSFQYNYHLLCLQRHQNSSFMPGTYVFPGGLIHPADADLKWHDLFANFGYGRTSLSSLSPNVSTRPEIFKAKENELSREVSLRITAIRETFEECGVLLCKQSTKNDNLSNWAQHLSIPQTELQSWQTKVHNDATEFYNLCENFKCYPDLWSLYEWSNWLTPTHLTGKRFDTAFFLACVPFMLPAAYESKEMMDLKWDSPKNLLNIGLLPPPQQYEITRLSKFESIDNLLDFAVDRSKIGVQLTLPVKIQLRDGSVYVLPGDSMYPENPSLTEKIELDKTDLTIDEFKEMSPMKNRFEFLNLEVKKVIVQNLDNIDGHTCPLSSETVQVKFHTRK